MTESGKLKPSEKEEMIKLMKEIIEKEGKRKSNYHKKTKN